MTYELEAVVPQIAGTLLMNCSDDEESGNRTGARHELVCRHWLRGICLKEWRCDFLHICDESRMPFCRAQRRHGRCMDQSLGLCSLRHSGGGGGEEGEEDLLPSSCSTGAANLGGGASGQLEICYKYLYGYCPHGPMCHLRHVKLDRHPQIPLPEWYLSLILTNDNSNGGVAVDDEGRRKAVGQWMEYAVANIDSLSNKDPMVQALLDLKPLPSLIPPPPRGGRGIRCFILKSGKIENILTSVQKGIWATGRGNVGRLQEAYGSCQHVILLMSANESGGFQGFCRMASSFDPTLYPGVWGSFSNKLSPNFRLQWLKQTKLDFQSLSTFTNPLNANLPIKKSRDGQELPYELAEIICNILTQLPHHDLLQGTPLQHLPKINHQTFFTLNPREQLQQEIQLGLRPKPLQPSPPPAPTAPTAPTAAAFNDPNSAGKRKWPTPPNRQISPNTRPGGGGAAGAGGRNKRLRAGAGAGGGGGINGPETLVSPPGVNPYLQMAEQMRRR